MILPFQTALQNQERPITKIKDEVSIQSVDSEKEGVKRSLVYYHCRRKVKSAIKLFIKTEQHSNRKSAPGSKI